MWYFQALHCHAMECLRPALNGSGIRVLDAGCGTGGFLRRLAAQSVPAEITGIDLSPIACALARERGSTGVVEGSVTSLPYPDGHFSAVTSLDVIYHLDHPSEALREFHRVLRPGGRVIINVPAYRWLWSYHDEAVHGRHRFTRPELTRLLIETGFAEPRGTYWNLLPLPAIIVKRKLLNSSNESSDVRMYSPWLETGLSAAMALERAWIRWLGPLPAGCSILMTAIKRG